MDGRVPSAGRCVCVMVFGMSFRVIAAGLLASVVVSTGILRRLLTLLSRPVPCLVAPPQTSGMDIGGAPALLDEPVEGVEKPMEYWEHECHALNHLLQQKGFYRGDEERRAIENLPERAHVGWSYYEKWSAAIATCLQEKGIITADELERELFADDVAPREAQAPPQFAVGQVVRVRRNERRATQWRRPHLRTPGYIFGATGIIERHCGAFNDPSLLAYGATPDTQHLYRVRFLQKDVWPEVQAESLDELDVEIYESWLEAAGSGGSADEVLFTYAAPANGAGHAHEHSHGCGGVEVDFHGEAHHTREQIEEKAVAGEGGPKPGTALHEALVRLSLRKGLVSREELRVSIEKLETAGQDLPAARLVARAWVDAAFRERLLADAHAAAIELGVSHVPTGINTGLEGLPDKLTVVANEPGVHNLVVCTLCSCYPRGLLGAVPSWYKSRSYRARAVRRPRELLREAFGLNLVTQVKVRVHDSTADLRYMVLPERPAGTEGWDEDRLRELVTRDSMVGVAPARSPV